MRGIGRVGEHGFLLVAVRHRVVAPGRMDEHHRSGRRALGDGARRYVVEQFSALGSNLVIVLPGRSATGGFNPANAVIDNWLTWKKQ